MHYVNWKKLVTLILVATSSAGISSCQTGSPELKDKPSLWGASSKHETLYRKAAKDKYEYVSCKDPKFDDYICVTKGQYIKSEKELIDMSYQCEKWK